MLSFLRTKGGAEVDLIVESPTSEIYAIEIKSKPSPAESDFSSGFEAIKSIMPKANCICCGTGLVPRLVNNYQVLPYQQVLDILF